MNTAEVYVGLGPEENFMVVWKSEAEILSIFTPSAFSQKRIDFNISGWEEQRESYRRSDKDFNDYPDLVNAAWHHIGQRMILLNRRTFVRSTMRPGTYYRRIWRGNYQPERLESGTSISSFKVYGQSYTQSLVAAASLFEYLTHIFQNVEPSPDNYNSYGHKSRELLMLACTEIEAGWRAVLDENSPVSKSRYTTIDYFKVSEPLRLAEWSVCLVDYPIVDVLSPFKNWHADQATKSLVWYDAYNAVKHHREAEFSRASLINLLNAAAALFIMQVAQWGPGTYHPLMGGRLSPFRLASFPKFSLDKLYIPSIDGADHLTPEMYFGESV